MGRRKPLSRYFYNLDLIAEDGVRRRLREQAEKMSSRIETGITAVTAIAGAYFGATSLDSFAGAMIGATAGATVGMVATLPVNHYFPDWYEAKLNRNWEEAGKPLSPPYNKSDYEKMQEKENAKLDNKTKEKVEDKSLQNATENIVTNAIPKFEGMKKAGQDEKTKTVSLRMKNNKAMAINEKSKEM